MKQPMRVLTSSQTNEWYTPPEYIEMARRVMGGIDLDPASCAAANKWIKAASYFTENDDGLAQAWYGRVWLNPPYGKIGSRSSAGVWAEKLAHEFKAGHVEQGILLTKAVPGYNWWEELFASYPVCFARKRIMFLRLDESGAIVSKGRSKTGSSFWYFGSRIAQFETIFSHIGTCIQPFSYWYLHTTLESAGD